MINQHVVRAVKILKENRYLTLGTSSKDGIWVAPVNYVIGPEGHLHFYSAVEARHSRDIEKNPQVVCAIYNSTAVGEKVDGMQFIGNCSVVSNNELERVSEYYFKVNFPDQNEREWWYRPPSSFEGDAPWRFYKIELAKIYIIDLESVMSTQIDRRLEVEVSSVLDNLKDI